jgi:hypothetical protein
VPQLVRAFARALAGCPSTSSSRPKLACHLFFQRSLPEILSNIESKSKVVVDAGSAGRFIGVEPEAGLRGEAHTSGDLTVIIASGAFSLAVLGALAYFVINR